ncbi:tyrosine-type recombinase/integrase [Chelatococcus sambhunathii]|uniref:Tyrosine-type recombinase/integrase n=2 Tax=Chelatococcus sambhunathii TaxID=363953 RepID=A0ABU1DHV6_9HYPH|nr:tyrosine-type recombinase/integrase [Chelatococcus sambhunathii]
MVSVRLKYVIEDVDRHGNVRLYFRRKGYPKIRLRGAPGSDEFMDAYRKALAGAVPIPAKPSVATPGSLRAISIEYFRHLATRKDLEPSTVRVRRGVIEGLCREHGDKPLGRMMPHHVADFRDDRADRPEAANAIVRALRGLFDFAVEKRLVASNPARSVKLLSTGSQGHRAWTLDDVATYEAKHPLGTSARLALALLLYTGQRRSDVVLIGRQHVRDGAIYLTQQKNRRRKPITVEVPIVSALQEAIDAGPTGDLAFLRTEFGRPFTANGFGNRFRKWCDEAGLKGLSAHGLRKAAAARLADLGATEHQIMAVTGHQTSKEVSRYTKSANRKRLAASAMALVEAETGNKRVPLSGLIAPGGTKSTPKPLKRKA